jgi:uncharacterized protein (TIGR02246 family)
MRHSGLRETRMMRELGFLRDFAQRYTAAWCSRDAASVAGFFAENGSLSVNGAPAVGQRAITEVVQGFMTAFPDMELLMDDVHIESERALYYWTFIGTNTGPGGTGHWVRFSGFEEWKIGEDELITESQGHFDSADYQRQLKHGVEESL